MYQLAGAGVFVIQITYECAAANVNLLLQTFFLRLGNALKGNHSYRVQTQRHERSTCLQPAAHTVARLFHLVPICCQTLISLKADSIVVYKYSSQRMSLISRISLKPSIDMLQFRFISYIIGIDCRQPLRNSGGDDDDDGGVLRSIDVIELV